MLNLFHIMYICCKFSKSELCISTIKQKLLVSRYYLCNLRSIFMAITLLKFWALCLIAERYSNNENTFSLIWASYFLLKPLRWISPVSLSIFHAFRCLHFFLYYTPHNVWLWHVCWYLRIGDAGERLSKLLDPQYWLG